MVGNDEAGTECTGATGECAVGECIQFSGEDASTCRQECVPGECETFCRAWDMCLTVLDSTGAPRVREDGRTMGVCGVQPTGDLQPFAQCGGDLGRCTSGTICMSVGGSETSMCLPECTTSECPEYEGFQSDCRLQMTDSIRDFCALVCEAENAGTSEGCPEGLTCTAGGGSTFCIY